MSELLKLPHLVDENSMTNVQVGGSRIKARLNNQRSPFLELALEPILRQNLVGATGKLCNLFLNTCHALSCSNYLVIFGAKL